MHAATEIANTSKHSRLEKIPRTKSVDVSKSVVINMLLNETIMDFEEVEEVVPDYMITLADGSKLQIYEFTRSVIDYWKLYLESLGITYIPQDEHTFFGNPDA